MKRALLGSWKRLAVHGTAAVLFGIGTLVWPSITLWALVLLWGAFAFVDGVTALSAAITDRVLLHRGWVAFSGISGIVAGVLTLVWPSITAMALLVVIAMWSFAVGGSRIALAYTNRKQMDGGWSVALGGVALVVLGFLLIVSPSTGALGITWAIGWLSLLFGVEELWLASEVRRETKALFRPADVPASRHGHAVS